MTKSPHLRPVGPDETATPATPATITEAVEAGSSRDVLAAMRNRLAAKLDADEVSSNAIASAYKELRELDRLIRLADAERIAQEGKTSGSQGQRRSFNAAAI